MPGTESSEAIAPEIKIQGIGAAKELAQQGDVLRNEVDIPPGGPCRIDDASLRLT